MSDQDAFDRAVKALRETAETSPADVARTRMRVMQTLHRGERRGRRTMWVLLPIAAVLAGSTALAKNSDVARRIWTDVAETIGIAAPAEKAAPLRLANERSAAEHTSPARPSDQQVIPPAPAVLNDVPNAAAAEVAAPADNAAAPSEGALASFASTGADGAPRAGAKEDSRARPSMPRGRPRPETTARAATPVPVNPPPEPVETEAPALSAPNDGEAQALALYKNAYRLHFVEQKYTAALAAWDEYLRSSPAGRLVVEARYNRAIALVRLGRRSEAEIALAPFARGEVNGGYRAREARELLDVLNAPVR
jgi:TolA-binding protein